MTESSPVPTVGRVVWDRAAMHELGRELAAVLRAGDLVILSGQLGAGKTTLTQGIGAGLGVRGPITSPTFALARSHPSLVNGPALLHVDAYRLNSLDDMVDLDLEESLADSIVIVEWGEGKVDGLAEDRLLVRIGRRLGQAEDLVQGAGGEENAPDPDEDLADPREVAITALGPRWLAVDLSPFSTSGAGNRRHQP
jgi:tRNA threonylcarbamoyladenosine biosynthesis protein TsaE